jgi:hypothetical protein
MMSVHRSKPEAAEPHGDHYARTSHVFDCSGGDCLWGVLAGFLGIDDADGGWQHWSAAACHDYWGPCKYRFGITLSRATLSLLALPVWSRFALWHVTTAENSILKSLLIPAAIFQIPALDLDPAPFASMPATVCLRAGCIFSIGSPSLGLIFWSVDRSRACGMWLGRAGILTLQSFGFAFSPRSTSICRLIDLAATQWAYAANAAW